MQIASAAAVFLTEAHHQVQPFPASDTNISFWRQMTLASVSCRLWIEVERIDDEDQTRVLIAAPSELEQLTQDWVITRVGLLSPGHLNGTGRWSLDPLAQLWRCQAFLPRGDTCSGWIHVLGDGRELADCSGMESIFEFCRTQRVYLADEAQADRSRRSRLPIQATSTTTT